MAKKLFEKIEEIINKHIIEVVAKEVKREMNSKSSKQSIEDIVKKEINNYANEMNKPMFEDIFGNKCIISKITKDHILPKSEGGTDNPTNIIMLCESSNKLKGNLLEGKINNKVFKVHDIKETAKGQKAVLNIDNVNIGLKDENKKYREFNKLNK